MVNGYADARGQCPMLMMMFLIDAAKKQINSAKFVCGIVPPPPCILSPSRAIATLTFPATATDVDNNASNLIDCTQSPA